MFFIARKLFQGLFRLWVIAEQLCKSAVGASYRLLIGLFWSDSQYFPLLRCTSLNSLHFWFIFSCSLWTHFLNILFAKLGNRGGEGVKRLGDKQTRTRFPKCARRIRWSVYKLRHRCRARMRIDAGMLHNLSAPQTGRKYRNPGGAWIATQRRTSLNYPVCVWTLYEAWN